MVKTLLIFIAVFSPIAFGAVDILTIGIIELAVFLAAFLWLIKSILKGNITFADNALNLSFFLFFIIVLMQFIIGKYTFSSAGTIYPYATKFEFLQFLAYALIFFLSVNNFQSRKSINLLLSAIITTGAVLAVYGIFQKLAGAEKIFWLRTPTEVLVFFSSFQNCNYFASYVNTVIFLSMSAFFAYTASRSINVFNGWAALFIFAIICMIASLFYTFSQGAIVTFLITTAFFYYIFFKKSVARKKALLGFLAAELTLSVLILLLVRQKGFADYSQEFVKILTNVNRYGMRIPMWLGTIQIVKLNPFSGIGLGTFQYIFPKYKPPAEAYYVFHCHNEYLEILAETGLLGLAILASGMSIFLLKYIKLLNSRRDSYSKALGYGCLTAAFAGMIHSLIDSPMRIGANSVLFWFILAVGFISANNHINSIGKEELLFKTRSFKITNNRSKALMVAASFLIFLYLAINVISISAAHIYFYLWAKNKNINYIKKAISLEPDCAEYRYAMARILFKDGNIKGAAWELEKAIKSNPSVSAYHRLLGLAYIRIDKEAMGVTEIKKAQELKPLYGFNYLTLALYYFNKSTQKGRIDPTLMAEGVKEYKKAVTLDQSFKITNYKNKLTNYPRVKKALDNHLT